MTNRIALDSGLLHGAIIVFYLCSFCIIFFSDFLQFSLYSHLIAFVFSAFPIPACDSDVYMAVDSKLLTVIPLKFQFHSINK